MRWPSSQGAFCPAMVLGMLQDSCCSLLTALFYVQLSVGTKHNDAVLPPKIETPLESVVGMQQENARPSASFMSWWFT